MLVETKKPKSKDKSKTSKKCRTCSLDCVITRSKSLEGVVAYKDIKDISIRVFGSEKPKYTVETCPKKA